MAGVRFPLMARDRILLHLSDFGSLRTELPEYPAALTQDGIASRTGLARAHVALALKSAREEGLVDEIKGRVTGESRRRKIYLLSILGKGRCHGLMTSVMGTEINIRRGGAEARKAKLSEASFSLDKKVPLVELALSVQEGGILMLDNDGAPIRPAREEDVAGDALAADAPSGGDGAGPVQAPSRGMAPEKAGGLGGVKADKVPPEQAVVSSPAKLWDKPDVEAGEPASDDKEPQETLEMEPAPRKITFAGPLRADYQDIPKAKEPTTLPVTPPAAQTASYLPVSPWVKRGQLASVWIGAVALVMVFLYFGALAYLPPSANTNLAPMDYLEKYLGKLGMEFLLSFFLVMATLQWFLLGAKKAPSNVRTEIGIYLGGFLALYGSTGAFLDMEKFVGPCLWFSEGLLLLSTGLLLHPLEPLRKFQVAGASVGSFMVYLCLLGLWTNAAKGDLRLLGLGVMWFMIGCLLISSRIFHARQEYAGWLRTAAALSAGVVMITIGAFLAYKGLGAESFVEFLVGGAIIYYTAPAKREEWSGGLAVSIGIICGTVAVTVFWLLIRVSELLRT